MNARFWIVHNNDFVKLTLHPNQSVELQEGGATDEGYSYTTTSYLHTGTGVECECLNEARDCDGRLDRWNKSFCPMSQLQKGNPAWTEHCELEHPEVVFPAWERVKRGQRDQYAEMMGY